MKKHTAIRRTINEQSRGTRTSSASIRSRARQVVIAIIVVATALICLDAFRFESILGETRTALGEMSPEGMGSIGGWPLGLEMCIALKRLPTDKELQRLASAASQTRRIHIGLRLNCEVSEERLQEIRETFSGCNASVIAIPVATDKTPFTELNN